MFQMKTEGAAPDVAARRWGGPGRDRLFPAPTENSPDKKLFKRHSCRKRIFVLLQSGYDDTERVRVVILCCILPMRPSPAGRRTGPLCGHLPRMCSRFRAAGGLLLGHLDSETGYRGSHRGGSQLCPAGARVEPGGERRGVRRPGSAALLPWGASTLRAAFTGREPRCVHGPSEKADAAREAVAPPTWIDERIFSVPDLEAFIAWN